MYIYIDFETRSGADLVEYGADVHLSHPWAGVWCIGYTYADHSVSVSWPGDPDFIKVLRAIAESTAPIVAHNAQFEWQVWNAILAKQYRVPALPIERFVCTMATGYAMSLPGSLDNMSAALGITEKKDLVGSRLAVQMSKPRSITNGVPTWWDEPEKLAKLYDYCRQDVIVEREVHKRLRPLPESEQKIWCLDAKINDRGVYVDAVAGAAARTIVEREQTRENARIWHLTNGAINGPSEVKKLTEWVKTHGVDIPSLAKQDIIDTLQTEDMPPLVREVLEIRQVFAKTSTAKIDRMLSNRSANGRLKGLLQYHGSGTGRWAGRRVQPHNLPRPVIEQKEIDSILDALEAYGESAGEYIRLFHGPPLARVADCLRGLLCAAPRYQLFAGDFANIEGRVLAWLAGESWKLKAFADFDAGTGHDLYLLAASRIYHKPVESFTKKSPERMIGKVSELALGYQGGCGAFQSMASAYGLKISDAEADGIKVAWRDANPHIKQYWYDVERAAVQAIEHSGVVTTVGPVHARVAFRVSGSFLWCALPSGRALCYPYPRLVDYESEWGPKKEIHYKSVDTYSRQWGNSTTYGGKLVENITQAVARDVLADAIVRLDAAGWNIILHVHDEIVSEMTAGDLTAYCALMKQSPVWAQGLPIAVEGWTGHRYRK